MESRLSGKWAHSILVTASLILAVLVCAGQARATTYEVGPGKPYENIGDVPLEDIAPGDTVLIYYRATPYKEKWVIVAPATESTPVTFSGVPGGGGELPIIDGMDAVTRPELNFWGEERSIIKIGGSNVPYCHEESPLPSHIIIENLEMMNGRPPYQFTGRYGVTDYVEQCSPVYVEKGENIFVKNCILHDSANGVTCSWDTHDLVVEGCHLYDNGYEGSIYRHSIYTESHGILVQYNHLAPLRVNCPGNNVKDRSCGTIVRYNWIENGARQLDLVDSDYSSIRDDPRYGKDYVYGNVLYEAAAAGSRQMIHYGGDMGDESHYRKGPLLCYNNTFISKRTDMTSLFRPQTNSETVECFNNIGYVPAGAFYVREAAGTVYISHNWFYTSVNTSGCVDDGTNIIGADPGFVDFNNEDFHLAVGSDCIDEAKDLPASYLPDNDVIWQYVKHHDYESRPSDPTLDIGGFEYDQGYALTILTTTLPDGYRQQEYSELVSAIGGVKPYSWSVISGSLPAGLTLNADTGIINGTPTEGGTFNFTVQVTDSDSPANTDTQALTLEILLLPVEITTTDIRDWWTGAQYSQGLSAFGGNPPYTWSVVAGSLPPGLSLNSSTGEISGVPTAAATYDFTVEAEDSQVPTPDSDTQDYSLEIATATGSTYFVSETGSDTTGDGSYGSPWATIQHAVDNLVAGDCVVVLDGTFAGFRIGTTGTAAAPIKILSNNIGGATINALGTGCNTCNVEVIADVPANGVDYVSIDGFVVTGSPDSGISVEYGDHVTIVDCEVSSSGATGILMKYSDFCLIEGNESYGHVYSGIAAGWDGDYDVFRRNLSYNNGSSGINILQDAGNTQSSSDCRIERNVCYGGTNGLQADGLELSIFSNNIVYGNASGAKGLRLSGVDGAFTSRNNRVLNNTMVSKSDNFYTVFIRRYTAGIPDGTDNKFFNNILYHYSTVVNRGSFCIDTAAKTGFESNYNVVMERFGFDDNASHISFAEWQALGYDLDSIQATDEELFTDPANKDYTLAALSPAIDAGTELIEIPMDLVGNTRPMGTTHDIGCYEAAGTPAPLDIKTTSLPDGKHQEPYSEMVYVLGGQWPYTWSVASGNLPDGLSLDSRTGEISGTPTAKGLFNFTVQVDDSASGTDTQALSIDVTVDPLIITTASLPDGYVNVAYSETLEASGGITPYSWAVVSGSLPAGLSLNSSTGEISGTPTSQEVANFTVEVTDSDSPPMTDQQALSITINTLAPLDITTTSLPDAIVNEPYSQTLAATGGWPPYSWAVISGSLPDGLSLNSSTGEISGTATTEETADFTVEVTDSQVVPETDQQPLSITVTLSPLVITTTSLPDAIVNQPYSQTLQATGGLPPITWAIISGSLPAGLSLTSSTGEISGTPTTPETANFTVEATDSQTPVPDTDTQALSITVNLEAETDTYALVASNDPSSTNSTSWVTKVTLQWTPSVADDWVIIAYAEVNGESPGTNARAQLLVDGTGYAALTHRPKDGTDYFPLITHKVLNLSAAQHTATIQYMSQYDTDYTTIRNARIVALRKENLEINYGVGYDSVTLQPLTETFDTYASTVFTPSAAGDYLLLFNAEHRTSLTHSNYIRPVLDGATLDECETRMRRTDNVFTWASYAVATLDATSHTVALQAAKETGAPVHTIRRCRVTAIRLDDRFANGVGQSEDSESSTQQTTFQQKLTRTWTAAPAGYWLLLASGDLQGADTNYSVEARAQLNDNDTRILQTREPVTTANWMNLAGFDVVNISGSQTLDIDWRTEDAGYSAGIRYAHFAAVPLDTGIVPLQITTTSLDDAVVGEAYSQTLAATGGVTPYSWAVISGSLPAGLSLNSSTGEISGTPTTAETANFTVEVTDSDAPPSTDQQALAINVYDDLVITTSTLPDGEVNVPYSHTLAATGGLTPYTWSVVTGSLPAGLSLNSSTGEISGTPTAPETANFTVEVVDSANPADSDQQSLSITINPPPLEITTTTLPDGQVGVAYSQNLQATGGITPYSWAVISGSLPAGLSLNSSTGEISGTPTTPETANFTVEVTDSDAPPSTDQQALSIHIDPETLNITTASLPDGQIDLAYSETLQATGGITPYSWAVISGSLPAGLSLNSSTGEISGTPTTGGTSNFTVEVTDSDAPPSTDQQALSIYVPDDLVVTTSSLPDGQIDVAYSETLAATGGVTPYSWSIVSGSLPAGLSLNSSTGEISGTPTTGGTSNFTVRVTDSQTPADTDDQALSIYVPDDLVVTTASLPDGQIDVAYSETLAATGGVTPYSWAVVVGSLPAGLSLNSSTGEISGTPTTGGTSNFTVRVTDSQTPADTDDQALSIYVPDDLVVTTSSLPDGQIDVPYSETLAATGGVTPYSWSIVSGGLPAGLSLNSSTGEISGTPTTEETANFTVEVTDSQTPADSDQQALSITINAGVAPLEITTTSLPDGQIDVAYSETLQATGGITPYSWAVISGSLPAGLSLNSSTGEISGTPTTGGTSNFTVEVTDSDSPPSTDQQALSIYIPDDLVVTTSSLPDGQIDVAYSETLAATGGVTPYSWSIVSGSLPTGLSLNSSTGEISGTPTTGGTSNFTVRVTDSQTPADTDDQALSIYVPDDLVVTTSSLPDGTVGVPYSETLAASGGVTPYSWAVVSGSLPAGLSLNSTTGEISGTPTSEETANFTVEVTDSQTPADSDQQALSITINPGVPPLEITTTSLPDGQIDVAYSQTLQATGGVTPYSWAVISGSLPAGLSLNSSTGEISGTPTTGGTSNFTVEVTDSDSPPSTDQQALSIYIPDDLVVTTTSLPDGTVGVAYSQTLAATGGVTPYTWSIVSGSLPAGLSLNSSTGVISGTPTTEETANFTVEVTDSQTPADSDQQALSITVNPEAESDTYALAVSNDPSTTNSTSWVTKVTLQWTPSVADDWVIIAYAEVNGESPGSNARAQLVVDGTGYAALTYRPKDSSDYAPFITHKVLNLSASQHTATIEYMSQYDTANVTIRSARIVAVRKENLEINYGVGYDSVTLQPLTETFDTYASTVFTPSTAGDYLLLFNAEHRTSLTHSNYIRPVLDGATLDECEVRMRRTDNVFTWTGYAVATLDATSHTVALQAAKETGAPAHYIRRCRVTAIRLDDRFANGVGQSEDSESFTQETTFQQKLTKTWTAAPAGYWLVFASGGVQAASTSYSAEARAQLNDTDTLILQTREPVTTADWMNLAGFDVVSMSGSQTLDVDWRTENGTYNAGIRYAHFAAVPLDTGAAPPLQITTTSLDDAVVG
ncbi:MAG: putative Ig domain-containing protein, partial [Planctomycetota bacterium]